ncbi:Uncharacterised protein [Mycobacteroides abscessus]|nr:Uncharacterised protein [Mycobacteroides abscessus]
MPKGALVLESSATFSNEPQSVPPQSPSTRPAAHCTPPTTCCTKSGSCV